MITSLPYTGKITIETKSKKVVSRNHGTANLFRLFSVLLCKGRDGAFATKLPAYFMLYNKSLQAVVNTPYTAAHKEQQVLKQYVVVDSYTSIEEDLYMSNFGATLTSAHLYNFDQYTTLSLALVSGDKQDILAVVEFSERVYDTIRNGGQAIVKWQMMLSNWDVAVASI